MNETKFHISLVTAETIFFAAALSMCLSTATGADLYTSPRSDLMWIIDGDTCLLLAKSDSHVTPPVRGVFGMREAADSQCDSLRFYYLDSLIDPCRTACESMTVESSYDESRHSDSIYVTVSLPNYPRLRCVLISGLYETLGTSASGTLRFRKSRQATEATKSIGFTLYPAVAPDRTGCSRSKIMYDFVIDADTSSNTFAITIPAITPSLINMAVFDNELILIKGNSVFWQGKEYTRETLPNGEVAKRLANQRFWPPHMPAKTVGKPFLTLDHEKIITCLAFGRQGSSAGFVKAEAIGEIYEPLPLAESESGRN